MMTLRVGDTLNSWLCHDDGNMRNMSGIVWKSLADTTADTIYWEPNRRSFI
jgi:hypothetical protein